MKAFHGDESLKQQLVEMIKWHEKQDKIVQGKYGIKYGRGFTEDFRGCAVGCAINSLRKIKRVKADAGSFREYSEMVGIPFWVIRVEECIFEMLPRGKAKLFPLAFTEAIKVGSDLEPLLPKFISEIISDLGTPNDYELTVLRSIESGEQITLSRNKVRPITYYGYKAKFEDTYHLIDMLQEHNKPDRASKILLDLLSQ